MKINQFMKNRKTVIVVACVAIVAIMLGIHSIFANSVLSQGNGDLTTTSNINPRYNEIMKHGAEALTQNTSMMAENTVSSSTAETKPTATAAASTAATKATTATKPKATAAPTAAPQTTRAQEATQNIPFATAQKADVAADYSEQWNLGYLIAIDNPDTAYACAKVTLTDEDRDLLERLCYGEFGSGGFIGACLIAQCVKDSMCFEGYSSVEEVIRENHYDGSTEIGTSDECRQAVRYIFDENHDAVQHRMLYMYNPYMVQSSFHESQNFILSYAGVRFFDRWA